MEYKNTAFALALCLLGSTALQVSAQVKKGIVIKGRVAFQNPEILKKYNKVWLYTGIGKGRKLADSATVNTDGSFSFAVKAAAPGLYQLDILKWQTATFWTDQDVNISARGYDTSAVKLKNSGYVAVDSKSAATQLINTATYNQYLAEQEMNILSAESLAAQQYRSKDSTWLTHLRANGLIRRKADFESLRLKQLIKTNQNSPALVYLLSMLPAEREEAYFAAELEKLITRYPGLAEARQLKSDYMAQAALRNSLKKGSPIPQIAYNDPEGNKIDINSFKGKYVLVDFWASWCGPCRKSIPEIKALYGKYKDKGFEVLSISVDTDVAAWKKAMHEEAMPWSQVLSPDKNKTMADFMISGIPTLYLVDREGKIVDKFVGFSPSAKSKLEQTISKL
ncbi:TlpA family protein disulfide reductase [Pedobacter frigoris]|uniref:TlpA family protein disulfide reductase n=1 Tax=Pedobacter frigoris TaxID=2571272 RepID=A0A4U1CLC8_9SPHI|nr:TlpA disulfide reductase family protein [Pedobacter frigoris]TKC08601.1 TlpA family protein disulfide reductase [Pedobacter frigoris]